MAYIAPVDRSSGTPITVSDWNQDVVANIIALKALADSLTADVLPTGTIDDCFDASAPSGYVFLSGLTIGDAASGATERANADCEALFAYLWNNLADAQAPVSGGRGLTAAADWAAHKTLTLPDARGRVIAGDDDMGGTAASRLTSAGSGIVGATLGASGGAETHTLAAGEVAGHIHTGTTGSSSTHTHTAAVGYGPLTNVLPNPAGVQTYDDTAVATSASVTHTHTFTTASTGAGGAHANVQPSLVCTKIIKL